jgi:hypothetical protein
MAPGQGLKRVFWQQPTAALRPNGMYLPNTTASRLQHTAPTAIPVPSGGDHLRERVPAMTDMHTVRMSTLLVTVSAGA